MAIPVSTLVPDLVLLAFLTCSLLDKSKGFAHTRYAMKYVGISTGPAARDYFELVESYPNQADQPEGGQDDEKIKAMKQEWKVLQAEFKNFFMKPTTVTFINDHGLHKVTGENKLRDGTRGMFTKAINDALHLRPDETFTEPHNDDALHPITFEGYFDPVSYDSNLDQLWYYFELVGGDPRCTTLSPCFGFYTEPKTKQNAEHTTVECEYSLLNLIVFAFLI